MTWSFLFSLARYRYLQRALGWLLPKTGVFKVVNEIRLSIPFRDEQGPAFFLMNGGPEAFYHYEKEDKAEVIKALPFDGVFLDIGANIGLFTFYISSLMPRVTCFAFEPHPLLANCLRESAALSPFPKVCVEEIAISAKSGPVTFHEHRLNQGGGSLVKDVFGPQDIRRTTTVESQTLDAWVRARGLSRVDVIKLDAQGAEGEILKGAQETILRFRPTFILEVDYPVLLRERWKVPDGYGVRRVGEVETLSEAEFYLRAERDLARGQQQSPYIFMPRGDAL